MVKVLVGQKAGDRYQGFWAEFEGEEVSRYEDTRGEKSIVYTLYRCTAYDWECYRVHVEDESNPVNPVYELRPYTEDQNVGGLGPDYTEPYAKEQIAATYPLFLKDMDYFREVQVDPKRLGW